MKIYCVIVYSGEKFATINAAASDVGILFSDPHEEKIREHLQTYLGFLTAQKGYHRIQIAGDAFYYAHSAEHLLSVIATDADLDEKSKRALFQNIEADFSERSLQAIILQPEEAIKSVFDKKVELMLTETQQVKQVMLQNLDKMVERGEKIEETVKKTEQLQASAFTFARKATDLKQQQYCPFFFALYKPVRDLFYRNMQYSYEPEEPASRNAP